MASVTYIERSGTEHTVDIAGTIPQLQQRAMALEISHGQHKHALSRLQAEPPRAAENPFWQVEVARLLLAAGETNEAHKQLNTAQLQLAELRKTPARLQLALELQALLTQERLQ